MNFDEAISAHVSWKTKLRSLVSGQGAVDAKTLGSDVDCALGKWLHGEGSKYAKEPAYHSVKDAHRKFHQLAGSVAQKVQSGQRAAASYILDGPDYMQASMAVVQGLTALRRTVEGP